MNKKLKLKTLFIGFSALIFVFAASLRLRHLGFFLFSLRFLNPYYCCRASSSRGRNKSEMHQMPASATSV